MTENLGFQFKIVGHCYSYILADYKENDEQQLFIFAEWGRGLCKKVNLIILPVVVGVMVVVVLVEVCSC